MNSEKNYGKIVEFVCPQCGYELYGDDGIENYCDKCFNKFVNLDGTGKIVKMVVKSGFKV